MNKWLVAVTVMLPTLVVIIDTSVVKVSLGHIRGSLSAGIDESTWAITSYLAANAIVIPMTGWLSRFFGRKRFLLVSIALFTVSSFLCGASWNLRALIFFGLPERMGARMLVLALNGPGACSKQARNLHAYEDVNPYSPTPRRFLQSAADVGGCAARL